MEAGLLLCPLGLELVALEMAVILLAVLRIDPSRLIAFGWGFDAESAIIVGCGFLVAAVDVRCTLPPPSLVDTRPLVLVATMELETVSGQLVTLLPPPSPLLVTL